MALDLTIDGRLVRPLDGRTLFDAATSVGVHLPTSCVASGKCKECLIEVVEGLPLLSPRTAAERHLTDPFRLACQTHVPSAEGRVRCQTMRRGEMRIERHAARLPVTHQTVALDPAVTRDGAWVLLDGRPLHRHPASDRLHGLALDIGTTTVVLRIVDLETGDIVADGAFENPQRFGGSDVMSRIHYDTTHPGKLLRRTLARYLGHALESAGIPSHTIYEVVVVGNSTMRDLFFRLDVASIGQNPYQSVTEVEIANGRRASTTLVDTGRRCLLPVHPEARVYGAPIVSGHVGADAAAAMLAVGLDTEHRHVALMDIGTNTELVVGTHDRILAASCPAGPAFEGGAIRFGMPALEGAIEDVEIGADGMLRVHVIGGGPPTGICGSGLIDLLSELRRTGRMNELGRLTSGDSSVAVAPASGIRFFEQDINELAQAKGANAAGLQVVFSEYGLAFDDIDVFYVAGGFGRHVKPAAAKRIGLIPNIDEAKIVRVGNAAIEGATIALVSMERRRALERMVSSVTHCRLETHPQFFDFFVDGCQFSPMTSARVRA